MTNHSFLCLNPATMYTNYITSTVLCYGCLPTPALYLTVESPFKSITIPTMPVAINSTKLIQVLCGGEEELQRTNWIDRWMFFYCFTATLYQWEQWHTLLRLVSRCITFLPCNPILNPHAVVVGLLEPQTRTSNKAVFHVRFNHFTAQL